MRGERSKDVCYLWKPEEERKDCKACQIMSALKRSNQTISRASKLCLDPIEELQNMHTKRE